MKTIANTFGLLKSSWRILLADKEILLFPLVASAVSLCMILGAGLAVFFNQDFFKTVAKENSNMTVYGTIFLFYFVNYFIMTFFNSAIVACAVKRFRGGDPTFGDGIRAASSHLSAILIWSLISSTVGILLGLVRDNARENGLGQILTRTFTWVVDVSWALVSFFVVPIMIIQGKGAVAALKESAALVKKTWGHQITANVSFGLFSFLFILAALVPTLALFWLVNPVIPIVLIVLEIFLLSIVVSALEMIFQSALYLYTAEGSAPSGFDPALLSKAVGAK